MTAARRSVLPVLLLLFAGSGCAALIYEIVWFQLLQLAIGSSAVSLGVLLGTYMGGMCLGSLFFARYVSISKHPLRVYAVIEAGIGIFALFALFLIPGIDSLYALVASGEGILNVVFRAVIAAICLLPPTLLMGASLPAMARWVESDSDGVAWLGFFYGGNIVGAVFGCLLAGFYLLRIYDMATATFVGVALNALVAGIAWMLAQRTAYASQGPSVERPVLATPRTVFVAIAISGACALGAEVVWTRLLALLMGATTYTFSIILAVFLVGLGIGSSVGALISRTSKQSALGYCQLLCAAAIAWAAYTLSDSLPYWPINPTLATRPVFNFHIDIMRAVWTVLPAACLWGASFPLALAAAGVEQDNGSVVGKMYAANTVGGILGALLFSLIIIPSLGTKGAEQVLIGLAAIAAVVIFGPSGSWIMSGITAAMSVALILAVNPVPWQAVAYGRRMTTAESVGKPLYEADGMNSSIVVSQLEYGAIYFHVSGKVEASTEPFDMRLQRMLGHIPALIHQGPKSVLIVGFGAGVTAGTFVVHPEIEKITVCELEPLIPPATGRYFAPQNHNVFTDKRTRIHYDDARHFVLTTKDKFDVITSDPIHPWVKGTATLYSREYFQMVKQHLNPGGVVTQWVPLYESDPDTVKSEIATFFEVFPNGTIWANDNGGQGYDVVLLGQADNAKIDLDVLAARLAKPEQKPVVDSLREVGFNTIADLFSTYDGNARDLQPWLSGAVINTDRNLRLQYMAGMGVNFNNAPLIGDEIRRYAKPPREIFSGSPDRMRDVLNAINGN